MKKILLILSFLTIINPSVVYSKTLKKHILNNQEIKIVQIVKTIQPNLLDKDAKQVTLSVLKHSKELGLDWKIFLAILIQESSLTLDPQECYIRELHPPYVKVLYKTHHRVFHRLIRAKPIPCVDYGISQVNYYTWGHVMRLSKERLLTDPKYAIWVAKNILQTYKKAYPHDWTWYLRYHSGTSDLKAEYQGFILKRLKRIQDLCIKYDVDSYGQLGFLKKSLTRF